jgi:predicted  nucleic acid-binding Zn ribbon protein
MKIKKIMIVTTLVFGFALTLNFAVAGEKSAEEQRKCCPKCDTDSAAVKDASGARADVDCTKQSNKDLPACKAGSSSTVK